MRTRNSQWGDDTDIEERTSLTVSDSINAAKVAKE